ncbi:MULTISPECIES: TolC family protein [Anaeromyxobacter]|uniref:TolC family protein n=2 Tax=Anaeromyxobacteraceae TaxID=1524215 RepID=UPI001F573F6B|nr:MULTISPECIES: TolC family protein [unclassified Anaeromyxobacter]
MIETVLMVWMVTGAAGATAASTGTPTSTSGPAPTSTSTPTPAPTPGSTQPAPATLSLSAALAELDAQNLTLAQARARADEASGVARQAAAPLLPTLSAGATYTRNSDDAIVSLGALLPLQPGQKPPAPIAIQPLEQLVVSGAARVPILVPNAWFELSAARSGARAAALSADAARSDVRAGFAQAAHAAIAAEEAVTASEHAAASAAELARSADRRVTAGTAAPLDALRARTEQVRRESDLVRARAELERARLALGILLGRETPVRIEVPASPADASTEERDGLVAAALAGRPELASRRARVDAADAQVRGAWARLAPQLSAGASIFRSDVAYPTGEKDGWRATVDLSWPLYDGGLRYGKRREAEAQRAGAEAAAEAERLGVVQQVEDAHRDLGVAVERLRLAGTQRGLAADAAASARRSYEAGVASSLDVIDANDREYAADIQLADARARAAQARIALDRAAGRAP